MEFIEAIRKGKTIYELPLRVCYYARVSSDHELQATSIVNQVDYFEKYIDSIPSWKKVEGYIDEGISGKDVKRRENFLRMIERGKNKEFDLILTKSVSRFARNTIDSIQYTNLLLQGGVGVFFLNDNIITFYGDSEFRLTLMASIAQDELRKLSESVQFGLRQSIQRGVVLGNNNILGYVKDQGKLVVVSEESVIVRDIFLWFVTGKYTYKEVGEKVFSKYQKRLDSTGIRRVLMNYKYKGYYCGGKSQVVDYKSSRRRKIRGSEWVIYPDYEKVPPIIEESVWDRVQDIIEKRKRIHGKYQNKLYCMKHQRVLKCQKKNYKNRSYHYYVCAGCCSFSDELLDRIYKYYSFHQVKVWVTLEDICLLIK